jgi:GH25 family lysozyme M1 (1,4-beta-N-acetylmuramidase)
MIKNPKLVIDVSHYQERLDVPLLKNAGVEAVIVKSGQGMRRDSLFVFNGQAVVDGGLTLMAYYWDDIIYDPVAQAKWAVEDIHATGLPVKYLWIDQEQWWSDWDAWLKARRHEILMSDVPSASPANISIHNKAFMKTVTGLYSQTGIYSSYGFIESWAKPVNGWIKDYRLWLAHYGKQPQKPQDATWEDLKANWLPDYDPLVPTGADQDLVVGHQFTGDIFRLPGVTDSQGKAVPLDINIFEKGFLDSVAKGHLPEKPPAGQTPPTPTTGAGEYFVNVYALNIRSGPAKENSVLGTLSQNVQVKVTEISGKWAHLEIGGWVYAPYLTPVV